MADSSAQGTSAARQKQLLQEVLSYLREVDGSLCQVVAEIDDPELAEPWHQLIHRVGVIRDEVGAHVR